MSMYEILRYANMTGNNPNTKIMTRKDLSTAIKENYGKRGFDNLQDAFKRGYLRKGRLWGFVLTKKGFNKYMELRDAQK